MKDHKWNEDVRWIEMQKEIKEDRKIWMMGFRTVILQVVGIIAIICQLFILWMVLTKPRVIQQQVHVPIRSGEVTMGVPCFAVYNDNGVLKAITAEADMHGVLREFNVLGGRIDPTPLPEPWRWFELNAAFSMEEP